MPTTVNQQPFTVNSCWLTVAANYALYVYRHDRALSLRFGLTVDGEQFPP